MSRWPCIAIVAAGCGHPTPAAVPPTPQTTIAVRGDATLALEDDLPQLAVRSVKEYQDLARAVAESNCADATAKVRTVADANADVIAANERVLHAGRDKVKQLRTALQAHEAELDAAAKAIAESEAMAKCSQDPAFAHAMDRFGEPS